MRRTRLTVALVAAGVAAVAGLALAAPHPAAGACQTRAGGALPDPRCTPGLADPALGRAQLCPHLGPAVVRKVSQATKDAVRTAYADHTPGEIDHLISLELGGSNDQRNLWPQDGPVPNAKDAVENRLHAAVCAGTITLAAAQHQIATDWRH